MSAPLLPLRRRFPTPLLLAAALAVAPAAVGAAPKAVSCSAHKGTGFSATARGLSDAYSGCPKPILIRSPDGRSLAAVWQDRRDIMHFAVRGRAGILRRRIVAGPNHALAWAPDSRAFFLTINDGGLVGSYLLSVGLKVGGRLRLVDLTPLVTRRFGHPVRCFDAEGPNVAGIAWLGSSRRLLVAAEILPHSNCDSMGNFRAYVVDPYARRIVAAYGQLEAKRRFWKFLGPELRNANDSCARRPEACFIPQLHPRSKAG
jgi:hypothetical protein